MGNMEPQYLALLSDPWKRSAAFTDVIDKNDPAELRHWTARFGISFGELAAAIQVVGPCVGDLSAYLRVLPDLSPRYPW
jgi:hypothetical protein